MGNKQEELQKAVQLLQVHNLTGIIATWWDSSPDQCAVTNGYGLFRKDRLERQGGGVAPHVTTGQGAVKTPD